MATQRIINWGNSLEIEEIIIIDDGDMMTIRDRLSPVSISFHSAENSILSMMIRMSDRYRGYDISIAPGAMLEKEGVFWTTKCVYRFAPSVVINKKIIHGAILAPEDDFWREFVRRYR